MFLIELPVVVGFGIWMCEGGAERFCLLLTGQLFKKKK